MEQVRGHPLHAVTTVVACHCFISGDNNYPDSIVTFIYQRITKGRIMIWVLQCDTLNGCGKPYAGDLTHCPYCGNGAEFSSPYLVNPRDYSYDIETFPNTFTAVFIHIASDTRWRFEISDRVNQIAAMLEFLQALRHNKVRMVGYNNIGFDWPVLQKIMDSPWWTVTEIYEFSQKFFDDSLTKEEKNKLKIWPSKRYIEQLDLFLIKHFDNKKVALKELEIAMRMDSVKDLPYEPGTVLEHHQKDELMVYNEHDTIANNWFYARCLPEIEFREVLTEKYQHDFMNHNDTKIGKDYIVMQLESKGIPCYEKVAGKRQPRQTIRPSINLADVVFPYIKFDQPGFKYILDFFKSKTITETKGVFKDLNCEVDGIQYDFATGGLHASVHRQMFESNDEFQIVDVDVASYYPNMAIVNQMYPAHLSADFCPIFKSVYEMRKTYEKGTPENAMLKLALNGVYGDSNSVYSPYYDPFFTMQTTINGQLMLCMLVEQLIKIPGLRMIQANTDGVTFYCPTKFMDHQRDVCKWWEQFTCLTLEEALYSRMWVRDVNNYLAEYTNGKLKRIGDYNYKDLDWHKDFSSLCVAKAAEAALVRGESISDTILMNDDPFDFMIKKKSRRSDKLMARLPDLSGYEEQMPRIHRYYVSTRGTSLTTVAPPTGKFGTWKKGNHATKTEYNARMIELRNIANQLDQADAAGFIVPGIDKKGNPTATHTETGEIFTLDIDGIPHDPAIHTKNMSQHKIRETSVEAGWLTTDCADASDFDFGILNYNYYIDKAEKLVNLTRVY